MATLNRVRSRCAVVRHIRPSEVSRLYFRSLEFTVQNMLRGADLSKIRAAPHSRVDTIDTKRPSKSRDDSPSRNAEHDTRIVWRLEKVSLP